MDSARVRGEHLGEPEVAAMGRVKFSDEHPVDIVHRISAGLLGVILLAFAIVGFLNGGAAFFSTEGRPVLGMSTNGALSVLSVVAAVLLLTSSTWGGRSASGVMTVMGGLFILSGIVHLAILHTPWNILAFRLPNIFFSLIAGMVLLFLGFYGRLSGGLPPDSPYRRVSGPSTDERSVVEREESDVERAEVAMGDGVATPEQEELVRRDLAERRTADIIHAYRRVGRSPREAIRRR